MLFEWDPVKADINIKKHGISFEIAQTIFDDPFHLSILDSMRHHEERWVTIGQSVDAHVLVVVHLYRLIKDDCEWIRIISARQATRKERKQYEKRI
ncbi:MAG: hypothetical protein A3G32_07925 [Deltaproteobacteria bacterium RIFCSPLOWO2_12_FULL_40_28]|nr:MAG: hypothetical protein A3C45_00625 [Deltaproteobacteria bacterium RIFCSPHIGHO2_02_FULL_40_28]OGQ20839.1 MAG: hypothetical protein A3E27_03290 [Deltaproteobacteria bacterium RIFCSPHIGHO2_12_FULL_40_32]OGQ39240.1 MAG: hypothetical protein A3I69_04650 [Deltaproteobacteria bacterium RIFCSPLOWO2_02_FULL_40_36]OGQ54521.1 MAG: hypothetical protein A3G32_07925 [Deltaproteobacteria bacterium RIFCSPLOWO2_12_FULL_40_28]